MRSVGQLAHVKSAETRSGVQRFGSRLGPSQSLDSKYIKASRNKSALDMDPKTKILAEGAQNGTPNLQKLPCSGLRCVPSVAPALCPSIEQGWRFLNRLSGIVPQSPGRIQKMDPSSSSTIYTRGVLESRVRGFILYTILCYIIL